MTVCYSKICRARFFHEEHSVCVRSLPGVRLASSARSLDGAPGSDRDNTAPDNIRLDNEGRYRRSTGHGALRTSHYRSVVSIRSIYAGGRTVTEDARSGGAHTCYRASSRTGLVLASVCVMLSRTRRSKIRGFN